VLKTLKELKKRGVKTVILSTHPHPPKEAQKVLEYKVKHFKLGKLFDEAHATREYHSSKGEFIVKILKEYNIAKKHALMVGDTYIWDYKSAKDVGVDALLIESVYRQNDPQGRRIKKTIKKLSDILKVI
jgi:FMN phosphatase YigB (HAD superfamily)